MNIIELNRKETLVISGGVKQAAEGDFNAANLGTFIGGMAGCLVAAVIFAGHGAVTDGESYKKAPMLSKSAAWVRFIFSVPNLKTAGVILGSVGGCNLIFSGIGGALHYVFGKQE